MPKTFKEWWAENEERYDRIKDDRHDMISLFENCWIAAQETEWEEAQRAQRAELAPEPPAWVRPLAGAVHLMLEDHDKLTSTEHEEITLQLGEMAKED